MNGITVLSVGEYTQTIGGVWTIGVVLLLVFVILTLILGAMAFFASDTAGCFVGLFARFIGGCFVGLFACFIGGCMIASSIQESGPQISIPQYKVIVSDSVPYNEFVEKYKVLDIEGEIYTIIDKEEYEAAMAEIEGS